MRVKGDFYLSYMFPGILVTDLVINLEAKKGNRTATAGVGN